MVTPFSDAAASIGSSIRLSSMSGIVYLTTWTLNVRTGLTDFRRKDRGTVGLGSEVDGVALRYWSVGELLGSSKFSRITGIAPGPMVVTCWSFDLALGRN